MKKLFSVLLVAALLLSLACCGMVAGLAMEETRTEAHGDPISTGPVEITEAYTHNDPEELQFDHRHVLTCNDSDALMMQGAPFGVTVKQMFFVLYGDEERPVACYEYCVFESDEDAATYVEACKNFWTSGEAVGNVSVMYKDTEMVDADMLIYAGYGMLSAETCDKYLEATSTLYCYVPVE